MTLSPTHTKTSSRPGRYRHELASKEFFADWAPRLSPFFGLLQNDLHSQKLAASEFMSIAILVLLAARRPKAFEKNSGPGSNVSEIQDSRFANLETILGAHQIELPELNALLSGSRPLNHLLRKIRFRGIPDSARWALIHWLEGRYPLQLFFRVPSAREVFEMQKIGLRCASLLMTPEEMLSSVEGRDVLSFAVHDLIHAHEFYGDPARARQQIGFYRWIDEVSRTPRLARALENSRSLRLSWDYLVADMNSYCGHLLKTTHAVLQIHFGPEEFPSLWREILNQSSLDSAQRLLFDRVNHSSWSSADHLQLEQIFDQRSST